MMTITTLNELIEARKHYRMLSYSGVLSPDFSDGMWEFSHKKTFVETLEWLAAQGFALVPKEPTEEILSTAYNESGACEVHDGQDIISIGITAAIEAGDILRRKS